MLVRQGLYLREDSESDSDSINSMKGSRKKVHFTDSEDENKEECKDSSKFGPSKRHKRNPNFKLLSLNRGDIPVGSEVFRQVLKEISKTQNDGGDSDRASIKSQRSASPAGKSILKKK